MTAARLGSKHGLLPVSPYRRALGTTHRDLEQLLCRATSHRALKMPARSSHPLFVHSTPSVIRTLSGARFNARCQGSSHKPSPGRQLKSAPAGRPGVSGD